MFVSLQKSINVRNLAKLFRITQNFNKSNKISNNAMKIFIEQSKRFQKERLNSATSAATIIYRIKISFSKNLIKLKYNFNDSLKLLSFSIKKIKCLPLTVSTLIF
jgi:hypothetical protein